MTAIDPRTKLLIVMCISSFGVFLNEICPMLIITLLTAVIALLLKSPVLGALYRIRKLLGVLLAMVVIQSLFTTGGTALLSVGPFTFLTTQGLYNGAVISLRFLVIILSATVLLTSSARDLVQGLYQLKIPYELVFMVSLSIRFLPLLKEEATDMYTAIKLRGVEFEKISFFKKIKIFSYLLMPMIASVLNKAREMSIAVEMRGFRAFPRRTCHRSLQLRTLDYVIMLAIMSAAVLGIIYLRIT